MRILALVLLGSACGAAPGGDAGSEPPMDSGIAAGPHVDAGVPADAGTVLDAGQPGADAGQASVDAGWLDLDGDGLDDAWESDVARRALPLLSLHSQDGCPLGVIVYRVRPHPMAPDGGLLAVTYTYLFEKDCGLTRHVGDNEGFGATIDPSQPPERMITALRAISHQNTLCERTSNCGTCSGMNDCERGPNGAPILFSSKDKHAGYVSRAACGSLTCLDVCELAPFRTGVPLINVGEPTAPLVRDLTDAGLVTSANGWTEPSVFHFDPWGEPDFGGAGNVKDDLEDTEFLTPACR